MQEGTTNEVMAPRLTVKMIKLVNSPSVLQAHQLQDVNVIQVEGTS